MLDKPWKGYYLTAYGIAVKHGFRGTEEEWLSSLEGKPGAAAELRYNKNAKVIEWRPEGSDTWEAIVPLSELQGEIVSATLSEAEEAAKSAGTAKTDAMAAADAAKKDAMAAAEAEKKILSHIEEYGTTVKKAYVSGDVLYIQTSDGKVFSAGDVRGRRGDTGNSGVYIGAEEPTDPEVKVWIDPTGQDGMREIINILSSLKYDGGDVIVQADMGENDEKNASFVKNRTHYDYIGPGEVRSDTAYRDLYLSDGETENEHRAVYQYSFSVGALESGKTHEITFGDKKYTVFIEDINEDILLEEKDEWRKIVFSPSIYDIGVDIYLWLYYCEGDEIPPNGTELSIAVIGNRVKQLDEKYIPEAIRQQDWNQNDENANGYIKNRTHYDISDTYPEPMRLYPFKLEKSDGKGGPLGYPYTATITFKDPEKYYFSLEYTHYFVDFLGGSGHDDLAYTLRPDKISEPSRLVLKNGLFEINISYVGFEWVIDFGSFSDFSSYNQINILPLHNVKQLDEKYIPDTIARADLSNVGDGACKNLGVAQYVDLGTGEITHDVTEFDYFVAECGPSGSTIRETVVYSHVSKSTTNQSVSACCSDFKGSMIFTYKLAFEDGLGGVGTLPLVEYDTYDISSGSKSYGNTLCCYKLYGVKLPK